MAKTDSDGNEIYKGYTLEKLSSGHYAVRGPDGFVHATQETSRTKVREFVNADIGRVAVANASPEIQKLFIGAPIGGEAVHEGLQTKLYEKLVNTPVGEPRAETKEERMRLITQSLKKKTDTRYKRDMKYEFIRFHGWFAIVVRTEKKPELIGTDSPEMHEIRIIVADHSPHRVGEFIWVGDDQFISREAAEAMRTEAKLERNSRKFKKQRKPHERIVYRKKQIA